MPGVDLIHYVCVWQADFQEATIWPNKLIKHGKIMNTHSELMTQHPWRNQLHAGQTM